MIKLIRWAWRGILRWSSETLLLLSVDIYPDTLNAYILEKSSEATFKAVQTHLRQRGAVMCEVCTSTRGPLKKIAGMFACPNHVAQVTKMLGDAQKVAA
jgi:hypothetical protein